MNLLTDILPTMLEIDGKEYPINSDFRTCLKIILAFEDPELTNQERQIVLLGNLYQDVPPNGRAAIMEAMKFLDGGKERTESDEESTPIRVYSFAKDSNFIYAAFKATHNIDLTGVSLHWWQFLALFMDLGSETTFSQLVGLRKRLKTGKATKEERQMALELREILDLPEVDDRTLEEKEMERQFEEAVRLAEEKRQQHGG